MCVHLYVILCEDKKKKLFKYCEYNILSNIFGLYVITEMTHVAVIFIVLSFNLCMSKL